MVKRRTKEQIEKDNIKYLLYKNKKAISTALDRYDKLTSAYDDEGFPLSFAIQKVNLEGGRFNFENKNYNEVLAELTRMYDFISDPGSQVSKAREESNKYMSLFGKGMWARVNIYDQTTESKESTNLLNEEAASRAFRAYRNIERMRAAEIVNVGGFGSDNFVAYLYSMELQGKDSGVMGNALLDAFEDEKYGVTRDFSDLTYMPSNYSELTRKSRNMKGDIYENEW